MKQGVPRVGASNEKGGFMKVIMCLAFLGGMLLSEVGEARERLTLDMGHQMYSRIALKQEIRSQYPNLRLRNYELVRVRLMAKSRRGRGRAILHVGQQSSDEKRVLRGQGPFHSDRFSTYDRIRFSARHMNRDRGRQAWRLELLGRIKVAEVTVVLKPKRGRDYIEEEIVCGRSRRGGRFQRRGEYCPVRGRLVRAELIRDLSRQGSCRADRNWSYDEGGVEVRGRCRGRFFVVIDPRRGR